MISLASAGFDWDDGNRFKCKKHGVSIEEIEAVFANGPLIGPDVSHSQDEQRMRAFGRGESDRPVFVVFTVRESVGIILIRPLSARYLHAKEVRRYEASEDS
jgi:uncharacterized protein